MAGRRALQRIQIGRETTPGTPVSPRFIWRGNGNMPEDQREIVKVDEVIGIFGGADRTYIPKLMAQLSLADTEATFEQLPPLFNMLGLGTVTTNSAQGSLQGASGSTALFAWNVPTTISGPTISYTVEAGDNTEVEQLPYVIASEVKLSFAGGEAMKVSATLMARMTGTTATQTWTVPGTFEQVETILASRGTFYLAPAVANFPFSLLAAAHQVTAGNILSGEITFAAKWEPKFTVDSGQLFFHTAVWTDIEISGQLTLEHQVSGTYGAAGAGQKSKWRNEEAQLLRMQWSGGTIAMGTTVTTKLLRIDLPMKWEKFDVLGDQNGNVIVSGQFFSKWNEASAGTAGRGTIVVARRGTCPMSGAF